MENTTVVLKDIGMAFDYVNERYIFNSDHYPVMEHMTDEQGQNFALTHSLLHMQKSIQSIVDGEEKNILSDLFLKPRIPIVSHFENYKSAIVKELINLLKIAEILGISQNEMLAIQPTKSTFTFSDLIKFFMNMVATECEKVDHGKPLKAEPLRNELFRVWSCVLYIFKTQNIQMGIVWNMIPDYMKSK